MYKTNQSINFLINDFINKIIKFIIIVFTKLKTKIIKTDELLLNAKNWVEIYVYMHLIKMKNQI